MGRGQGYAGQGLALAELVATPLLPRAAPRASTTSCSRPATARSRSSRACTSSASTSSRSSRRTAWTARGSRRARSRARPGFEITGGSLGQGLSQAVGMALGERLRGRGGRVYCLLSDGELQEGQIWEACMAAGHYGLDNLVAARRQQPHAGRRRNRGRDVVEPIRREARRLRLRRATDRRERLDAGARRASPGRASSGAAGRPRLRERCRARASRASRSTRRCTTSAPGRRSGSARSTSSGSNPFSAAAVAGARRRRSRARTSSGTSMYSTSAWAPSPTGPW